MAVCGERGAQCGEVEIRFGFGETMIRIMLPVTYNQTVAFLYNSDIDSGTQIDSD